MKKSILVCLLSIGITTGYAVSKNQVNENLSSLNSEIKKVSADLKTKTKKHDKLKDAISSSDKAIVRSNEILNQLKQKQAVTHNQLREINAQLPEINRMIDEMQEDIRVYTKEVYQQIQMLDRQETSFFSANDDMAKERKKEYLIALLKSEQDEYAKLDAKLQQLKATNLRLTKQVAKIEARVDQSEQKITTLTQQKESNQKQAEKLDREIAEGNKELNDLQKERKELNRLLASLNTKPRKKTVKKPKSTQVATSTQTTPSSSSNEVVGSVMDNYDEPFFDRALAKPLNAKIIRGYGESYKGLKSNGVLYNADDKHVFAVSNGEVLYNSSLPGFGKVLVIAHGDNYVSVYGGIVPKSLSVGDSVKMGQVIANSGDSDNQPMGGVYFELRHLGKPVNPNALVNAH